MLLFTIEEAKADEGDTAKFNYLIKMIYLRKNNNDE